jgi:hypothetical protein
LADDGIREANTATSPAERFNGKEVAEILAATCKEKRDFEVAAWPLLVSKSSSLEKPLSNGSQNVELCSCLHSPEVFQHFF